MMQTVIRSQPPRRAFLSVVLASLVSACSGPGGGRRDSGVGAQRIAIHPAQRSDVVLTALSLLESRYRYGGSHPVSGFDCSGLVAYVFSHSARQRLPHNTALIAQLSRKISKRQLKAGDFVFFNTLNRPYSHMGIYIGEGKFVNAPSSGGRVRIDSLDNPYFAQRFDSARTLFSS
jgi:cell wall-associated NlpC family hydrolase